MRRGFIPTCHPRVGGDPLANNILSKRIDSRLRGSDAFTLIELSIVLVIIGLLVGGVLVGQDLIRAAQTRAAVSQIEKYRTATYTFLSKYNGLPGDLRNPGQFGLLSVGADGTEGKADGDKYIEMTYTGASIPYSFAGETAVYWRHLMQAGLIEGSFDVADYECNAIAAPNETDMPKFKIGAGGFVHITRFNSQNIFTISAHQAITAGNCYSTQDLYINPLTPFDARNIDIKLDNGLANSGSVMSIRNVYGLDEVDRGGSSAPDTDSFLDCFNTDSGEYATNTDTLANQNSCSISIQAQF